MSSELNNTQSEAPNVSVSVQYIKDFSFENLATPGTIEITSSPNIDLKLDINITKLSNDNYFEVALHINAKAMHQDKPLFIVELAYAGIFHLQNVDEEQQRALLSIHCTSILFPYARKIIADATQDAAFQPLLMDPIDFAKLYYKRLLEEEGKNSAANAV
jgi:preprotein translocase subunit SecB